VSASVTSALRVLLASVLGLLLSSAAAAWALDAEVIKKLGSEDMATKVQAINALAVAADPAALPVLEALWPIAVKVASIQRVNFSS